MFAISALSISIKASLNPAHPISKPDFKVFTYNILTEKYSSGFDYCPKPFLDWSYRKQKLLNEIVSSDADIICLQEVEARQFKEYFQPALSNSGSYDGVHYLESRSHDMTEEERHLYDGGAIFFKRDLFKLEEEKVIEFEPIALQRSQDEPRSDFSRMLSKDNIAIIVRLMHIPSGQKLIVGNVHLHWNPEFCDVKLVQSIMRSEELERYSLQHLNAAVILCGDFNSLPTSGVYEFLSKGTLSPDHPDFLSKTFKR